MSNMFEDRMRAKEAEKAKATAGDEERKAHRVRAALQVSGDLLQYIGTMHPNIHGPQIEVVVDADQITVRKKGSADTMEITALSPTKFQLSVNGSSQGEAGRSGMIDRVIDWMRPAS